jgi:diacylglycerol kinase (ATP)
MRAAAILGLGCSPRNLQPFQTIAKLEWRMGVPATEGEADVVLLFGGDGTIHRHLGPLVRLGLPVLIVPAGSGNDFARAIGFRRVGDSIEAWWKFSKGANNVRAIDLGVIAPAWAVEFPVSNASNKPSPQRTYFCCVAGIGLDSEVARRANSLPRWLRGHGGYALALMPTIFRFAPVPMKIFSPDQADSNDHTWIRVSDQPTILAAFANTPVYGGGMKIAPKAKMDDLLDICVVGGVDPLKLFCVFPTVYAGRHLRIREVSYFQLQRARIDTDQPLDVYADGEYVCPAPVEIAVEAKALKILVP